MDVQLSPGTQLGAYRIVGSLGTGGMGEVYRARQQDLNRDVALKMLPARLRGEPGSLARFEREVRVLAGLSHPNVLSIFDFVRLPPDGGNGRGDEIAFAVTELLEGRSLRAWLDGGALPRRKAVDWAAQAARGLAAAHEKGVVHRDLKPENLFVTDDGLLKILDFGLARPNWGALVGGSESEGDAAVTWSRLTEPGTVMGTVGYMSPEQVRGREADARSDIFSLGAVIYEMLSGRRAFQRDTAAETLTAILKEDPPELSGTRPPLPIGLERVVRHCLEKRPEERFQSARDLAFDLQSAHESLSWSSASGRLGLLRHVTRRGPWRALAAAALALAAFAVGRSSVLAPDIVPLPERYRLVTDRPGVEGAPALSPDGSLLAFVSEGEGNWDVYVQRVGGRNPINLTRDSPEADLSPAFSPDGQTIAFRSNRAGGGIFLMGATGESVRRLTDFGFDPAWSPDGRTLAVAGEGVEDPRGRSGMASPLWLVDVESGRARKVYPGDAMQPRFSPDGRLLAFWGMPEGTGQRDLWTLAVRAEDAEPARPVRVTDDVWVDWNPVFAADGRALYFSSDRGGSMNLWRVPIHPRSGRALGAPKPITTPAAWAGGLSLSRDGQRLAYTGAHMRTRLLRARFDPERGQVLGPLELWLEQPRELWMADLAPDGSAAVLASVGPQEDLFVVQGDGQGLTQITDDEARDRGPRFSPDGRRISFYSNRGGRYGLWLIGRDGSGLRRLSNDDAPVVGAALWSPDGRQLVVPGYPPRIFTLDDGPGEATSAPLPPAGQKQGFDPGAWLGREIFGMLGDMEAKRRLGFAVYDTVTGTYRPLEHLGAELLARQPTWIAALDARRALVELDGELQVLDATSGQRRPVGQRRPSRQQGEWRLSRDGRTLLFLERAVDADVWVADLSPDRS